MGVPRIPNPIGQTLAYLAGVQKPYMDEFIYGTLKKDPEARLFRALCSVRTAIIQTWAETVEEYKGHPNRPLSELSKIGRVVKELEAEGIVLERDFSLSRVVIQLNRRVETLAKPLVLRLLKDGGLADIFIMPAGDTIQGVREAVTAYGPMKSFFPYQKWVNWDFTKGGANQKYLFADDEELLEQLSKQRNSEAEKLDIFLYQQPCIAVVDCENSDAERVCSIIERYGSDCISKLVLVDDEHTTLLWNKIQRRLSDSGIPVERLETARVKEQKSLVDLTLSIKVAEEHYKNGQSSFLLFTSDSDIWSVIKSFPDVRFLVAGEKEKTGDFFVAALLKEGVPFVFLNDVVGSERPLTRRALLEESSKIMGRTVFDAKKIITAAALNLGLYLSQEEIDGYVAELLGALTVKIDSSAVTLTADGSNPED